MGQRRQIIVVGAGITGLACSFYLRRFGHCVRLLDESEKPGGLLGTFIENGFVIEAGPQFPRFPRRVLDLVHEVGLEREFVRVNPRAPRYILKQGRLREVPFSPVALLTTSLIGLRSKARIFSEGFRTTQPPEGEESIANLIRRKFGGDALDYLVDPVISAVFAGDPEQMGVDSAFPYLAKWERESGSIVRGMIKAWRNGHSPNGPSVTRGETKPNQAKELTLSDSLPPLGTFRNGMGALPKRLAETLGESVQLTAKVEFVDRAKGGTSVESGWKVRLSDGREMDSDAVVLATPADQAGKALAQAAPKLGKLLLELEYAPIAVVATGYDRKQVTHSMKGFGFMVTRREKLNTFYNVWNSSMIAGRAPEGKILTTSFAGGAADSSFVEKDEEEIGRIVEGELGGILGIHGSAIERFVWKIPKALPQLNVGQARRVAAIRELATDLPGLYLAGNYLEGRSLGDCVETAYQTAESVSRQFQD